MALVFPAVMLMQNDIGGCHGWRYCFAIAWPLAPGGAMMPMRWYCTRC